MSWFWVALAFLGGSMVLAAIGRFVWALRPQAAMRGLPATPLERLGWWGLAITVAVGAGMAILVAVYGATGFNEDATPRGIFWISMLVGVGVWAAVWRGANRRGGGVIVDERDRQILARSLSPLERPTSRGSARSCSARSRRRWRDTHPPR